MSHNLLVSQNSVHRPYKSSQAPLIPPQESLALDFKEALGLQPSSPTFSPATKPSAASLIPPTAKPSLSSLASHPPASKPSYASLIVPPAAPAAPSSSWPGPLSVPQRPQPVDDEPGPPQRTLTMATSNKAQAQCLQLCKNIAAAGDRVAERMAEYSTLVKHLPSGFDNLANGLLDACQILFYIEAGLDEAVRSAHPLPLEMVTVLEKRFRAAQADFRVLDQMVGKYLEYEQKGAMGRMRRGFAKAFGDNGIEKMTLALQKRREDLKMSALMFQWNLGTDKIESEPGIGYIGLSAALDETTVRRSRNESIASDDKASIHRTAPTSQHRSIEDHRLGGSPYTHPLPLLPPPKDSSSSKMTPFSPDSLSGESSSFAAHSSEFGQASPSTRYTISSTASSYDGAHNKKYGMQDRLDTFEEVPEPSRELDALISDVTSMDLDSSKVVNLKSEPFTMPRRRPRSNIDGDKVNSRHALVSAARSKDHKLVQQLLDRGVSPNTGPDAHALNEAILGQDAECLRLLLMYGADPNGTDRDGVSPLVAAAEKNFFSAAAALLKYGADPNMSTGPELETPLAIAAAANNVRFVHLLLMYGGNANQTTGEGNTLLISSINKKTPKKLIEMLLGYGADPNDKNREGKTALFDAIQSARADIVTALLENGANPNLPGPKHMLWPAAHHPECLQVLLNHGADHKKCPGVLELSTSINSMEAINILLDAGVDPNAKKDGVYTPLCTSIRDNRSDIFQLLLTSGADPNVPASEYPAFKCVTHHREHFLPALVAAGSKLNSPKGILETAVTSNNAEALRWLLDQGLDPDEKNAKGHTPLTSAIRENRTGFIDTLLARGANPNIRGQDWPVCMAVKNPDVLKRILGVLPEPRAFKGVVEMAVVANQLESVKLLLAAGVSVEDRNGGVFSPLTTALREHRRDIVTFLINEGGADVNAPGEHLPIVKALRRCADEHQDVIDELLDKGADPNKVYRGWNGIMQALENGDAGMLKKLCEKSGVNLDVKDELGRTVTEIAVSRRWEEAVGIMLANAL
ncbi:ankyrin repeats (3 copies) domain-containing protein [Hirsutella rhossiliensis]|uniref:Ankyrin repeats (3 copies) domain-containing protein n=1 Tax=Hirsutella rhossiliensis TaxID=111463 RepID=A0A9P8N411_9HYPO|nr:ankyrin repeats (3 copies) domain-containing protein [Hirsutella rhossiliensis]KAH0966542.1 ankyrin repeats (3 copies) domain-containing protein [Hirsutella rhossiliensis]